MAIILTTYSKKSSAILDYSIDWGLWLKSTEIISSAIWTVDTGLKSSTITNTTSISTVWLSEGTVGKTYSAKNTIWTDSSPQRKTDATIKIKVVS